MSGHHVTRRAMLGSALGAAGAAMLPLRSAQAFSDGPPSFGTARSQFTILRPANQAPAAPILRLDGTSVSFAAFRGKVVLVNFWATWCPACRLELPTLERLQQSSGGKDLEVLAVALDREGRTVVAPFLRQLNIRKLSVYLDPDGRMARNGDDGRPAAPFQLYGMPISYVIDPAGRIAGYMTGEADWASDDALRLLGYYRQAG